MTRRHLCLLLAVVVLLRATQPVRAQDGSAFDVFIDPAQPTLYFVDLQTGLSHAQTADGSQYSVLGNGILYQERGIGAAGIITADGAIAPTAWIDSATPTTTVQWVVSADHKRVAWVVTQHIGAALTSDLYIALADGSAKKLALHTSSTQGIELFPLFLTDDGVNLFYTRQSPDKTSSYVLFPTAADIFRLDVSNGTAVELPGEPSCLCAAGFSADGHVLMRLEPNIDPASGDKLGFKAHWRALSSGSDALAPAPNLAHSQAGDVVLSRDGNFAAYTSARGKLPTKASPERYVVVVVDLIRHEQRGLTDPLPDHMRPISFTGGDRAILLIDADKGGTYKLSVSDGTLTQVSADTYLGRITTTP